DGKDRVPSDHLGHRRDASGAYLRRQIVHTRRQRPIDAVAKPDRDRRIAKRSDRRQIVTGPAGHGANAAIVMPAAVSAALRARTSWMAPGVSPCTQIESARISSSWPSTVDTRPSRASRTPW